eukprot:TRINITY_DN34600_c0_g1_i1.p1 TRINITY_DN34600_c0_g1~~TRINITY_DN34600_c0_g1_i1.p1  ORF type:complete len:446 (+),score=73.23 TRINITY_DN34600_c0_g1_i1:212-1549(+)
MSSRVVLSSATPAVVSQRLTDLLMDFPCAAVSGIQWQTLVRKYEQRHQDRLDVNALGHDSPLAAVTTLLWDVLRVVDSEDSDNPIVAIEDSVALTPRPGSVASWPSLYEVLCKVVGEYGSQENEDGAQVNFILVSQLKPLLQRHWHADFDECSLNYLTEEGSAIKLKKMKHLLQALLRWREQRIQFRKSSGCPLSELDKVLEIRLEVMPSTRHNDLVLRCVSEQNVSLKAPSTTVPVSLARNGPRNKKVLLDLEIDDTSTNDVSSNTPISCSTPTSQQSMSIPSDLESELRALRAENAKLRSENNFLQQNGPEDVSATPQKSATQPKIDFFVPLEDNVFDNPFEPPPEVRSQQHFWGIPSPMGSTAPPSDLGFGTPHSCTSGAQSGTATPAGFGPMGTAGYALVPVGWIAMGDRSEIPSGFVQQARSIFERHAVVPNWFVQQSRQ